MKISGLNENSLQGDKVCTKLLKRLTESFTEADLSDCPDLAPVLFAIAAAKHGALFSGTRRLKIKESDRAEAMREELEKFGAIVKIAENEVKIIPPQGGLQTPEFPLSSHGDPPYRDGGFCFILADRRHDFGCGSGEKKLSRFF